MRRIAFWAAAVGVLGMCGSANAQAAAALPHEAWFPGTSKIGEVEIIPSGYRGKWAPSLTSCVEQYGVGRVTILPFGLDTYESGGRLVRITQSGQPRSVRLKLSHEGEGRFWDREEVWTLDETGRRLTILGDDNKSGVTLVRCN